MSENYGIAERPVYTENGTLQYEAHGIHGKYCVRYMSDSDSWAAIQLFGAVGSIAARGKTPQAAFAEAEIYYIEQQREPCTN